MRIIKKILFCSFVSIVIIMEMIYPAFAYTPFVRDFDLDDNWLLPGSSKLFNIINVFPSSATSPDPYDYSWTSSNSAFSVEPNGLVTAPSSGGITNLTVRNTYSGTSRVFRIVSSNIGEGTYMIRNAGSGFYLSVDQSSGYAEQVYCHNNDYGKWDVVVHSNGDIILQSHNEMKYLNVENRSACSGAKMILLNDYAWTTSRWKIEHTTSNHYKITPMLIHNFALKAPSPYLDGTDVIQDTYSQNSDYHDEWDFYYIGSDAFLLGMKDTGHDHISYVSNIIPDLIQLGIYTYDIESTEYLSRSDCSTKMSDSKIFVSRSHGNYDTNGSYILLSSDGTSWIHSLDIYDIDASNPIKVELSNCQLMLFVACYTAKNFYSSIVCAAVYAGADAALGFTESINCSTANEWVDNFFSYYSRGYSIPASGNYATSACSYEGNTDSWIIAYG